MGRASDRPAPTTVRGIVEDLERRLEPLRPAGPVGVLGVSLGGMSALAWSAARPGRFAAAVVINASARDLARPTARLRPSTLPALFRAARSGPGPEREQITLALTTTHHPNDRALAEAWAGYRASRPLRGATVRRQLLAGLRFSSPPQLGAPTLFVSGARDRLVHPRCTQRLAARYRAPHVEHPAAGHDLPLDAADWLIDQMQEFLRSLSKEAVG